MFQKCRIWYLSTNIHKSVGKLLDSAFYIQGDKIYLHMGYNQSDLINLLEKGLRLDAETYEIEFKDVSGGKLPSDLWRPITAFSQSLNGGVIFFGVTETNGRFEVTGGLNLHRLQELLVSYFVDSVENAATPGIHVVQYGAHDLLAIIVRPTANDKKPCFSKHLGLPKGACVRVGNSNRVLNLSEVRQMMRDSRPFKYDRTPLIDTVINDLSIEKIEQFLENISKRTNRKSPGVKKVTPSSVNAGILTELEDSNRLVPTVGGYLIFSESDPIKSVTQFSRLGVRCVAYKGTTQATKIVDSLDVTGTLDNQIEESRKFILKNIPLGAHINGTKMVEEYAYPDEAIREIVANAVIHRDYQLTETYTQVAVFSNRIEVSNPGTLPPWITVNNLKEAQHSRNEVISKILRDMNYMEELGRGIDIVYESMEEYALPEPIFKNVANTFNVTLLSGRQ